MIAERALGYRVPVMLDETRRRASAALLPAAGRGERLGRGPKALLPLGETTLLHLALRPFERLGLPVLVAAPPEALACVREALPPEVTVIAGGESRQETVAALLAASEAEVVLVHDAARPFLPEAALLGVLALAWATGAASAALPVADTLIDAESGATVPRERLRAVQTPQGFRRALLMEAHARAREAGVSATDDAALVRRLGHPVALSPGSAWLFKVTTPDDYRIAQLLEPAWRRELEGRDADA